MRIHRTGAALAALLGLALVGCSQSSNNNSAPAGSTSAPTTGSVQQASGAKPAPFDKGGVKIAMVRQSGAGDYFQQWGNGAQQQAKALGISMQVYDAQADNAKQATDMQTAMNSGVQAVIVDHGLANTMNPLIDQAIAKKIPTIIYDVTVTNKDAVVTHQSDADMAQKTLDVMLKDIGKGAPVGYVNVFGIAPLDRRNVVWQKMVKDNGWKQEFFVGKFTNAVATDNAQLVDAALKAHPNVKAIFAPYDELTKGTVSAVLGNNLGSKIKVYGIDISNADIEVMTKPGSPWVATAATDPAAVGAAVVRAAALKLAGQLKSNDVTFPATLITQQFLRDNKIANMAELRTKLPDLGLLSENAADWIPKVTF